jgi:DNA polymerase
MVNNLQNISEGELLKRHEQLKVIRDHLLHDTTAPLYQYRTENSFFPVIGEGNHAASIMFVGEAPGLNEAKQGRPFCGAAGKFLDVMLAHIGLDRTAVYITNIVKDRPPENRDPLPIEIEYYGPLLVKQIEIIKPTKIVTLGRFSMAYIMKLAGLESELGPISAMHGKAFDGKIGDVALSVVTLYHPAVALYNGGMRATLLKDIEIIN